MGGGLLVMTTGVMDAGQAEMEQATIAVGTSFRSSDRSMALTSSSGKRSFRVIASRQRASA